MLSFQSSSSPLPSIAVRLLRSSSSTVLPRRSRLHCITTRSQAGPNSDGAMDRRRSRSLSLIVAAAFLAVAATQYPGEAATPYSGYGAPPQLRPDYYRNSCPNLENIVRAEVARKIKETVVTIPATLRQVFHDCMAGGCDAAVLIASKNNDAEKDADDNESLAGDGFDTVNRVKAAVERSCPGVVSCADIMHLAARDVVFLSKGPYWSVELGRRDSLVSRKSDVTGKLPDPDMHVRELWQLFQRNGFSPIDLVALSGAHTVGFAHCTRFLDRLYNYSSSTPTDPSFNPYYADQLKQACPRNVNKTIAVNMDPQTPVTFDNKYFYNLQYGFGLFTSDQVLYTDDSTKPIVNKFAADQQAFFNAFVSAMIKLGRLGVKTGNDGEIRRVCTAFNHY